MYLSRDRIGLKGNNPNFYAYVHDSNEWVDIFGLDCLKAKKEAYSAAEDIIKNTSRRKRPRAVSVVVDNSTGKSYIGQSRGVKSIDELDDQVKDILPVMYQNR